MSAEIVIRAATLADSRGLGTVQLDSWRTTDGAQIKPASWWARFSYAQREQAWQALLSSDRPITALVATDGPEVVGFAWSARNGQRFAQYQAELCAIHLLPDYRQRGIGAALVGATARLLRRQGMGSLMLWTGKLNHGARAFYEQLGGTLLGEQSTDLDGIAFEEVAYGWDDIGALCAVLPARDHIGYAQEIA